MTAFFKDVVQEESGALAVTSAPWNSRKTKLALWWVGATQGINTARTMAPTKCHAAEKVAIQARILVLIVLTMPWMARITAATTSLQDLFRRCVKRCTLNIFGQVHVHVDQSAGKASAQTSVDGQELLLCQDVAVAEGPHARDVIGQREVNAGCDCNLTQKVEPACTVWHQYCSALSCRDSGSRKIAVSS